MAWGLRALAGAVLCGHRGDTDTGSALLSGTFPSWRKDGVNRGRRGSSSLSHTPSIAFRHLNSARIGYATEGALFISTSDTPSIAFRHLPLNYARTGYATGGALFVPAQLSTNAVCAPRKAWVLIRLWKQPGVLGAGIAQWLERRAPD